MALRRRSEVITIQQELAQLTLRDYWRVIQSRKFFIGGFTALIAGLALALSLTSAKTYEASASLAYRDVSQDLGTIGVSVAPAQSTAELAAAGAQTATNVDVARRVLPGVTPPMSLSQLENAVSASVDPSSNFVVIRASARSGKLAATIANAFARQAAALKNADARAQFAKQAATLARKVKALGPGATNAISRQQLEDEQGRFIALSNIAKPVIVSNPAAAPSTPKSPRPVFDTLLGAIIGLALAVAITFVRRAMDRRIRDTKEIMSILGLPLIGELSGDALGRSAEGEGDRPMSEADLEAVRIMRLGLDVLHPGRAVRVVLVTSPLPEEGKSTVAASLAVSAAAVGKRTLLVECDLRRPVLAERFGLNKSPGVVDYLQDAATPQQVIQVVPTGGVSGSRAGGLRLRAPDHLVVIAAGTAARDTDALLNSERCRELFSQVAESYDLVIVDSAPVLPVADTLELVRHVDAVVLCVRIHQTSRDQAAAALAAIRRASPLPVGLVATGVSGGEDGAYSYAYSYAYSQP